MPMHPIVSACGTAKYNTAKFITKILHNDCVKSLSFVKDSTISSRKLNISQYIQKKKPSSHLMSVLSSRAYQHLLHYKLSITKFLPAPVSPMSATSLHKKLIKILELTLTISASTRNSVNNYRVQPWVHLSPHHCKYLHGILLILSHSHISNINQVVVQVC